MSCGEIELCYGEHCKVAVLIRADNNNSNKNLDFELDYYFDCAFNNNIENKYNCNFDNKNNIEKYIDNVSENIDMFDVFGRVAVMPNLTRSSSCN